MTKYSESDLAKLRKIREENPEFAATLDEFRKQFPGMKITYLKAGDVEFGTPSPRGVVPCIDPKHLPKETLVTIPQNKELSVYERAVIAKQQALKGKRR